MQSVTLATINPLVRRSIAGELRNPLLCKDF